MQRVLVYKTSLMQKIADYVRLGYSDYVCGYVGARAASAMVRKFERLYFVGQDRNQRARSKAKGYGSAFLLMHELNGSGELFWILLVSPGLHPARGLESLQSALEAGSRITITGYELIRSARVGSDRLSWSWRLSPLAYAECRARVIDVVRRGSERDVRALLVSLFRTPGFSPLRVQVGKLCALFRAEWARVRSAPLPEFPRKLFYVARLKSVSISLSAWVFSQSSSVSQDLSDA